MHTETPFALWRKTYLKSNDSPGASSHAPTQQRPPAVRGGSSNNIRNHQRNRHLKRNDSPEVVEDVASIKTSSTGIKLEPQPSSSPADPLNWPLNKKLLTLAVISWAALAGGAVGLCNQFSTNVQAQLYHQTPLELSYSLSAAVAGLATGPILWLPLSNYLGKTSVLFYTQLAALCCVAWSSAMTHAGDFVPFVVSKWLGATFSSASFCLGGGVIIEVFFLHQRGRAFATYTAFFILGAASGGTLSGFIVESNPWPVEFYWILPVLGVSILGIFCFLDDSTFDRRDTATTTAKPRPSIFATNRIATLLPGNRILSAHAKATRNKPFDLFLIAFQPITLLAGVFIAITFGWAVPVQTLIGVFLQLPTSQGGYGFSPLQTACFSFISWLSILFAEIYGLCLNDRVPLLLAKRRGKGWRPEYRLYPLLLVPLLLVPSSLGLFGAALKQGLSYWALAVAFFGVNFSDAILLPVVLNYLSEGFGRKFTGEVFVVVNFYRFVLGGLVPFFFQGWMDAVGVNWQVAFGTMAFLSLVGFGCTGILWFYGDKLRKMTIMRLRGDQEEEGEMLNVGRHVEVETGIKKDQTFEVDDVKVKGDVDQKK